MLCHFILFNPHSDSDDSNSSNSSGEDDEAANTVDFWFKPSKFYHLMKKKIKTFSKNKQLFSPQ